MKVIAVTQAEGHGDLGHGDSSGSLRNSWVYFEGRSNKIYWLLNVVFKRMKRAKVTPRSLA